MINDLDTDSFFRRGGRVGVNFIFAVPRRVTFSGRLVMFAIALEGPDVEPVPFCSDILVVYTHREGVKCVGQM